MVFKQCVIYIRVSITRRTEHQYRKKECFDVKHRLLENAEGKCSINW